MLAVDIIVYPGFKALEAIGPMKVFDYTNKHLRKLGLAGGYQVNIVSNKVGMVASDTLMSLYAGKAISAWTLPDLALIVGSPDIEDALEESPEIVDWITSVASRIGRLAALCTGSFFLAAAGVLNGRRVSTHWGFVERLRNMYPEVIVDADAIFIREGNIWTSAGVTAAMDLTLALVEEDFGREVALEVARDLVIYLKRPGGQSQFSVHLSSQMNTHPTIRELQNWIMSHLEGELTVPRLAQRMAMSERNFARVFHREAGESPADFIERARFEAARRMLEGDKLPLKLIVGKTGFGTEEKMRRVFKKKVGLTPKTYRERFSSTM
nr:helix-turn-helix domain-containing protein [Janthinobacterium sp. Marseille]